MLWDDFYWFWGTPGPGLGPGTGTRDRDLGSGPRTGTQDMGSLGSLGPWALEVVCRRPTYRGGLGGRKPPCPGPRDQGPGGAWGPLGPLGVPGGHREGPGASRMAVAPCMQSFSPFRWFPARFVTYFDARF